MESIINLGIPHVGEQIFIGLGEDDLIQCRKVSQTWKILSEKAWLLKKWKGKMFEACETGKTEIVKLLLAWSTAGNQLEGNDVDSRDTNRDARHVFVASNVHYAYQNLRFVTTLAHIF